MTTIIVFLFVQSITLIFTYHPLCRNHVHPITNAHFLIFHPWPQNYVETMYSWYKVAKMDQIKSWSPKLAQASDNISLLIRHQKVYFHWGVDASIIFTHTIISLKYLKPTKLLTEKRLKLNILVPTSVKLYWGYLLYWEFFLVDIFRKS